jgi:hypothetical protein
MTQDRSRRFGQALMAVSALQLLLFLIGASRRSYAALALPVGAGLAVVSALTFWVGYTMATTNWDDPADYAVDDDANGSEVAAAEGAPPPESVVQR